MRRLLPLLVAFAATSAPAFSQNAASAPAKPATATAPTAADTAKALADFRSEMQAKRTDVLAKNISLSADQAAKFWPLYEKYQAEQSAIIDTQLKGTVEYANHYDNLDDAHALAYIEMVMKRDELMAALRRKWLPEFQKVLPTTTAVRVIQIDRRLSNIGQAALSSQIPLVH